jgi:hypothetical protein
MGGNPTQTMQCSPLVLWLPEMEKVQEANIASFGLDFHPFCTEWTPKKIKAELFLDFHGVICVFHHSSTGFSTVLLI